MVSYPLPPGESFSRVHGVSLAFVLALESHLCHKTGVLFEALVSMLRVCIVLRFTAAATGLGFRSAPAHYIAEQKLELRSMSWLHRNIFHQDVRTWMKMVKLAKITREK